MKKLLFILFFVISLVAGAQDPVMQWDYDLMVLLPGSFAKGRIWKGIPFYQKIRNLN